MDLCQLMRKVLQAQVFSTYGIDIPTSEVVGDSLGDRRLFCNTENLLNHLSSFVFRGVKSISLCGIQSRLRREVNNAMNRRDLAGYSALKNDNMSSRYLGGHPCYQPPVRILPNDGAKLYARFQISFVIVYSSFDDRLESSLLLSPRTLWNTVPS